MTQQQDMEGLAIYPRELIAVLYRRRYWLILPMIAGLLVAAIAVYLQKPLYRSSATLLIDSQAIPTSLVASPLTSIANERIAKIRQQIVSRDSLTALITKNDLFTSERKGADFTRVLDMMRKSIDVELVGANQGGNGGGSTIAFTLSFTYQDAAKAQAVTDQLTRMFLVEDKRFRTEQATGTATFLGRRAEELRRQLTALEEKRRGVEARYAGALPSHVALSVQSGATLRAEVSRIDAETQGLVQQNSLLAARAREFTQAPSPGAEALRRAEERVDQLAAVYSDSYPEVVAARAALQRQRATQQQAPADSGTSVIDTEIAAGHSRIDMLAARRTELIAAIAEMEHRTAQAPQASYELNMIEREYDNIKRQYESLREKQLDAQVAANLQSEDKGERFSVVDEPSFPNESMGAKPSILMLIGLFAGTVGGVVLILGFEILSGKIHGEASLAHIMKAPPMGIVPVVRDPRPYSWFARRLRGERARPRTNRMMMGGLNAR